MAGRWRGEAPDVARPSPAARPSELGDALPLDAEDRSAGLGRAGGWSIAA